MKITITFLMIMITLNLFSQEQEVNTYDFWLGEWEVSWTESNGKIGKGINIIETILNDTVIQESFQITEGNNKGFEGTSISVFNPNTKTWKQAWADNTGGFFNFNGGIDDLGNPIFVTDVQKKDSLEIVRRMVFKEIKEDGFIWDWQGSKDGGTTWTQLWQITYNKKKKTINGTDSSFDAMLGKCNCESMRMGKDGKWQEPVKLIWEWEYIMDGKGIQDRFQLANGQTGGSIRQYNETTKKWYVHYYSSDAPTPNLQSWEGKKYKDGSIILYSPQTLSNGEQGSIKLTFYDITKQGYKWKAELVNKEESEVQPFWKIECNR